MERPQQLILMKGHPGCAKSTVSRALARALRCPVIDKDDIRDGTSTIMAAGADALNSMSYDAMWRVVATQLDVGISVVVDCPLARMYLFRHGLELAQRYCCELVLVECVASDVEEWKRRLESRGKADLDEAGTSSSFREGVSLSLRLEPEDLNLSQQQQHPSNNRITNTSELVQLTHETVTEFVEQVNDKSDTISVERLSNFRTSDNQIHQSLDVITQERSFKLLHKPSTWSDLESILSRYAKCYEYDTGSTRKIVVDTTVLSTERAVQCVLECL